MKDHDTHVSALDAYLKQVERYLPPWSAGDILQEIRSHILDQAEAIALERGAVLDESLIQEALERLGPAQRLAAGYVPAVTLIRPEYTMPFAIYSVVASVLLVPVAMVAGLALWVFSAIVAVGLLFVGFVVLSRMRTVYRLPIWHSSLRPDIWKVDLGQGLRRGVHAVWPQPAMAAAPTGPAPARASMIGSIAADAAAGAAAGAVGGAEAAAGAVSGGPGSWPQSPPVPRRTPTEWLVAHSGPRHLRIHELFGAGLRAVFGFALAMFFAFSASPFPILDLRFDDIERGWRLVIQAPGLEGVRELGAIACMATCLSGLLPIFLGKSRLSLYGQIASQAAWAVLLYQLAVGGTVFSIVFTSIGWAEHDWPQVHSAIQSAVPLALGIGVLVTLLALVCTLVKLGMMEAWYRSQRAEDLGR